MLGKPHHFLNYTTTDIENAVTAEKIAKKIYTEVSEEFG